jgi:hypothetical protein
VSRAVTGILVVLWATAALADPGAANSNEVAVSPSPCDATPWAAGAWFDVLSAELAGDGIRVRLVDPEQPPQPRQVSVEPTRCDGAETSATLSFSSTAGRRTRAIDLSDAAPVARPRVLAIALADFIRSSVTALAVAPVAVVEPPAAVVAAHEELRREPPVVVSSRTRAVAVDVAGVTRGFSRGPNALFGPELGLAIAVAGPVVARVDGDVLFGAASDPLGEVHATIATFGASVYVTRAGKAVELGIGARGDVGFGVFRGAAVSPAIIESSTSRPLAFVALSGVASLRVSDRLRGVLEVDAGTSVYGFAATADQRRVLEVAGPMASLRLGLAWSL